MTNDTLVSPAGWPVSDTDPQAGDRIEPSDYWTDHDAAVLYPVPSSDHACVFCNDTGHAAERGVMPADYGVVSDETGETLAYTCHACISGAPVLARGVASVDTSDVYTPRDEYQGPPECEIDGDGITHPADRQEGDE